VHFAVPGGGEVPRPGDVATVRVTYGAPHHLVADAALAGGPYAVRRTSAGDAWDRRQAASCAPAPAAVAAPGAPGAVSLGLPTVRV
jgi:tRNA-2-methylthio-N6-dimethylallyladenosine synthase